MALAAVFMAGQRDFKRMLAYSSVEHMGILAVALGLGGAAVTGAFYHVLNNGLTKGVLFLAAGNIHRAFGVEAHRRGARRVPAPARVRPALPGRLPGRDRHAALQPVLERVHDPGRRHRDRALRRWPPLFLLFLAVIFIGMGATVLHVVQGSDEGAPVRPGFKDSWLTAGPPLAPAARRAGAGLWLPRPLLELFSAAARLVTGA